MNSPNPLEQNQEHRERQVFANRTLNMRSVDAVGYDMDYTLIHYKVDEWERAAFRFAAQALEAQGVASEGLVFDPASHIQGLILDLDLGNIVKATRFGYVINAQHGTRPLDYNDVRETYSGVTVDLHDRRFMFLNTLFSLSATSLFAQMVDRVDAGQIDRYLSYADVFGMVSSALDESHATSALKSNIIADPDRFCDPDPVTAQTLLDQRHAGKRLLLVTNSDWSYTQPMMDYAIGQYLPGESWRDLFEIVVVSASKPSFFTETNPVYEVADLENGLLAPHHGPLRSGHVYHGGSARLVEESLGLSGDQFLYVGDHLFGDVHASKATLRWRTALIMRELEDEIEALESFAPSEPALLALMATKDEMQRELAEARVERDRLRAATLATSPKTREIERMRNRIRKIDEKIAPLARAASDRGNPNWGLMMRAGSDKSMFARQVERHADLYTSRVANLGLRTPYAFYRAAVTALPHEDSLPTADPSA